MQTDDPLFRFSYRVFQTKFIVFELLMLGFSFYGMYKFAQQEFSQPSAGEHRANLIESVSHASENLPRDDTGHGRY